MAEIETVEAQELMEALRPNAGPLLGIGVVQALLGSAAIVAPNVATQLGTEFLGLLLLFAAALQIWQGLRVRNWRGTSLLLLAAALDVALGAMLLLNPAGGAAALTLLLAALLIGQGATRIALHLRGHLPRASGAFLAAGILGIVLGGLLAWEWPGDSVWAIGLLLGVNLLTGGLAMVALSLAIRSSGNGGPSPA